MTDHDRSEAAPAASPRSRRSSARRSCCSPSSEPPGTAVLISRGPWAFSLVLARAPARRRRGVRRGLVAGHEVLDRRRRAPHRHRRARSVSRGGSGSTGCRASTSCSPWWRGCSGSPSCGSTSPRAATARGRWRSSRTRRHWSCSDVAPRPPGRPARHTGTQEEPGSGVDRAPRAPAPEIRLATLELGLLLGSLLLSTETLLVLVSGVALAVTFVLTGASRWSVAGSRAARPGARPGPQAHRLLRVHVVGVGGRAARPPRPHLAVQPDDQRWARIQGLVVTSRCCGGPSGWARLEVSVAGYQSRARATRRRPRRC